MNSSFRRALCTKATIRKNSTKMQVIFAKYWQNVSVRLSHSGVLKRSTKGAMSISFRRAICTKTTISKKSAEMQWLSKLF